MAHGQATASRGLARRLRGWTSRRLLAGGTLILVAAAAGVAYAVASGWLAQQDRFLVAAGPAPAQAWDLSRAAVPTPESTPPPADTPPVSPTLPAAVRLRIPALTRGGYETFRRISDGA